MTPIQSQPGTLRGGTGTIGASSVFSGGPFSKQDLPVLDTFYTITGNPTLTLSGWVCVSSGPTSDFKARK